MFSAALAALAAGATVVTPTRRLAGAIRRAWDARQQASGARTWPAPDVLPWSAWQQRSWEAAQFQVSYPLPLLLMPQQELALWARVIGESSAASALLHLESAAQSARQAWETVCAWRLGPALRRIPLSEEATAFLGWSESFVHFCTRESLLDPGRLPDELIGLLRRGAAPPNGPLVVYGFDAIDPQRAALIEALRGCGTRVEVMQSAAPEGAAVVVGQPGARQELRAAALWARAILAHEPEASIGIVVPDLQRLRPDIARIFDEVLLPSAALAPWSEQPRPWNLSLGLPLVQWPLAHAALLLLELAGGRLPAQAAGVLLRSPFLGAADSERGARALLDGRLRRQGEPSVTLDTLEYLACDESRASACPLLLEHLRLLRTRARASRGALLPPSARWTAPNSRLWRRGATCSPGCPTSISSTGRWPTNRCWRWCGVWPASGCSSRRRPPCPCRCWACWSPPGWSSITSWCSGCTSRPGRGRHTRIRCCPPSCSVAPGARRVAPSGSWRSRSA
jgi:ATP-dependent helicase/nuclease subunit B